MYLKAIKHFKKVDPILYGLSLQHEKIVLEKAPDYFVRLTRSIVGQQLSVKAASTIYGRFEKLLGGKITAERILKLSDEKMRGCGISYSKIKYIKDLAQKVHNKELILESLENHSEEKVIEELIKVKGIGNWSAEMFLMGALAREDVFSTGDLGLKNSIKKHYKLKEVSIEKLLKISGIWSPYRTYASRILWMSLDNEPK